MKHELKKLIGTLPSEIGFIKRMRFHQGWWRAFVLAEEEGSHPIRKEEVICNTILDGQAGLESHGHWLSSLHSGRHFGSSWPCGKPDARWFGGLLWHILPFPAECRALQLF